MRHVFEFRQLQFLDLFISALLWLDIMVFMLLIQLWLKLSVSRLKLCEAGLIYNGN